MISILAAFTLSIGLSWWIYNVAYSIFFSPLREIPSPLVFQLFPLYHKYLLGNGSAPFVCHKYYLRYGPVFRVGWRRVLFVDQEAVSTIHGTYQFNKASSYNGFSYFGENVFSTRSRAFHTKRKRHISPAFTRANIERMVPLVESAGIAPLFKNFDQAIDRNKPIDLYRQFHRMAYDVIGEIALGHSLRMLETGDLTAFRLIQKVGAYAMLTIFLPFLQGFKCGVAEQLREFHQDLLKTYFSDPSHSKKKQRILDHYATAQDLETGAVLSKEEILAETNIILFAGTDTTSVSLLWFNYLLMKHPEVETKVLDELKTLLKENVIDSSELIPYHLCQKLVYLDAALKESMRILPPAPNMPFRVVPSTGATIMGHYLPPETECAVPIYSLHNSPEHWTEPERFLPERWLTSEINEEGKPMKKLISLPNYMPFLIGPRACLGKNLAWMELVLTLTNTLARYKFTLIDKKIPVLTCLPILRPVDSTLPVSISRRDF
ncbi:hypothetical protein DSO57_1005106 [Entomophthora muscae]|uniref:Uncharacterized protein n=1 Tax=Entomophthora muscae TaxID=34485 RepID=A0ACC2S9V6_9FUNG|nr:hypothetical protein DSO57_1005106 [Entomophthora muscae]